MINTSMVKNGVIASLCVWAVSGYALAQDGQIMQKNGVTRYLAPLMSSTASTGLDYANAIPMPLPMASVSPSSTFSNRSLVQRTGTPGFSKGSRGTGERSPVTIPLSNVIEIGSSSDIVGPQEYGTSNHPFTTSRVNFSGTKETTSYPNRAAGKLYFKIGASTYVCSGSLIKKGVVVTAAHCVADFGNQAFYSNWEFVPALNGTTAPYGKWQVTTGVVMTSYYDGTDDCAEWGVVCTNDVAVLVLTPKSGVYAGNKTGFFSYGWDGYGFTPDNLAQLTQLGYPVSHDAGKKMQRTESQGFVDPSFSNNTVWGSRQTGGSSGGPEVVNLGVKSSLNDTSLGSESDFNTVVGVTSWGYISTSNKQQGASPFLSSNINALVDAACSGQPDAC